MDHKLLLQLLHNKTEEIQSLLNHFKDYPNELDKGLNLLSDRIESLLKEFRLMKHSFVAEEKEVKEEERVNVPASKEITPNTKSEKEPMQAVVVDKSKDPKENTCDDNSVLSDILRKKSTGVIGEKIISSKLTNIKSAIGINDRFLFIRELFGNNVEAYNSSVDFINQTDNYELIEEHFKRNTKWDFENATVIQFMELAKRKF